MFKRPFSAFIQRLARSDQAATREACAGRDAIACLQVCIAYPPNFNGGGAALTAFALSEALALAGHRISVVAPKLPGAVFNKSMLIGEARMHGGTHIWFLGTWLRAGFKTLNPGAVIAIPRLIWRSDVVIIHGVRTFCGSIAGAYCMLSGKRYVVFPHGMAVPRWRSLVKKCVYDAVLGKLLLRRAQKVVCLSASEREEVIRVTGRHPSGVPVIDVSLIEKRPQVLRGPSDWKVARILLVGRLVPEKSIELVIEAIAARGVRSAYEVLVAGPEENARYSAFLRRRARDLNVVVRFAGAVYGSGRSDLIMESHLLALVSEYESYGRVVMESLRLGTPVLVSNTCGIAHDVSSRRGVVVDRSVEAIGSALSRLCARDFADLRALRRQCLADVPGDEPAAVSELVDVVLGDGPRNTP